MLLFEKKYEEGLELINKAIALNPESSRTRYTKGVALSQLGEIDDAIRTLEENAEDNPSYYKNYAALATIYIKTGQKLKALEAMRS